MSAEPPHRPVAFAAITGAVKGALAGLLVIFGWFALFMAIAVASGQSGWKGTTQLLEIGAVLLGASFAGATLCGFDAAARRVTDARLALACRIAAGAVTPIAAASPYFGLATGHFEGTVGQRMFQGFELASLALAAGQVAAGPPHEQAHEAQGCRRLAIAGVTTPLAFGLGLFFATQHGEFCATGLGGAVGGLFVAVFFWTGQKAVSPLARRLAFALEPDLADEEVDPLRRLARELAVAEQCIADAARLDSTAAERLRESAFEALERAEQLVTAETPEARQRIALRRAELFLLRGDLERADAHGGSIAFVAALRAELARRKGDLDHAAVLAQRWHDDQRDDPSYRARSARANALALLALVRADQGRTDEARTLLADSKKASLSPENVFHHLTPERVRAYIDGRPESRPESRGEARPEPPGAPLTS